jgi:predicted Zn-dependent protease
VSTSPTHPPGADLDAALAPIREALETASGAERAALLRRAGDLCVRMNEPRKALSWLGRAVDQHLEMEESDEAAAVCREIIRVQPDAVRARCTLTWIALGAGQETDAARLLTDYVDTARQAGQTAIAAQQLGWMFEASQSEAIRARIVVGLLKLGEAKQADTLAAELAGAPLTDTVPQDRDELWARVLQAAVGIPTRNRK